jgi:voltage-gated sodium channel
MTHQRLKDFAQSKQFFHIVNYAIISFAFLVGTEMVTKNPDWQDAFRMIDYGYMAFFTLEIIIRILAEDHPGMYFVLFTRKRETKDGITRTRIEFTEHGFWNYFDFALIALSLLGLFAQLLLRPTVIQIGRLFRIFRIIRLLEISEHLKEVERRIMSIIPTVISFVVLLLILTYIYAILGMYMFDQRVFATCNFSTIVDSFVTLFQVMTLDNWSDVMVDTKANTPAYHPFIIQMYFVSFVVCTSIIAFNVFIAVMTSQVADRMEKEIEEKEGKTATEPQVQETMTTLLAELRLVQQSLAELKARNAQQ